MVNHKYGIRNFITLLLLGAIALINSSQLPLSTTNKPVNNRKSGNITRKISPYDFREQLRIKINEYQNAGNSIDSVISELKFNEEIYRSQLENLTSQQRTDLIVEYFDVVEQYQKQQINSNFEDQGLAAPTSVFDSMRPTATPVVSSYFDTVNNPQSPQLISLDTLEKKEDYLNRLRPFIELLMKEKFEEIIIQSLQAELKPYEFHIVANPLVTYPIINSESSEILTRFWMVNSGTSHADDIIQGLESMIAGTGYVLGEASPVGALTVGNKTLISINPLYDFVPYGLHDMGHNQSSGSPVDFATRSDSRMLPILETGINNVSESWVNDFWNSNPDLRAAANKIQNIEFYPGSNIPMRPSYLSSNNPFNPSSNRDKVYYFGDFYDFAACIVDSDDPTVSHLWDEFLKISGLERFYDKTKCN